MLWKIQVAGFALLAVAGVAVWFVLAPERLVEVNTRAPSSYNTLITTAMSDYEANDENAGSAPQQQVVNGWVARDLLQIDALMTADQLRADLYAVELAQQRDERLPAFGLLLVVGLAFFGGTSALGARPDTAVVITPPEEVPATT